MEENKTYLVNMQNAAMGEQAWKAFQEEAKQPMKLTTELLMKLLADNKDTQYGRKYGFADIHSVEEYQRRVPVITYDDIAQYLEKMMEGEQNVLTAYKYNHFNETSGTVGTPKVVPMTDEQSQVFAKYNNLVSYGILKEQVDNDWMRGRAFCTASGNYRTLKSGLTVGEAASKMAEYIKGGKVAFESMLRTMYTSPLEGLSPPPRSNAKYIHARFALMDKEVRGIISGFSSVTVLYLQYIANNYELLINDIETGSISEDIELPDETRASLLKKIEPMPQRAAELREIFKNGSDIPFVKKIWPKFSYIFGVGADGFSVYDRLIKERFVSGDIAHLYSGVTASEGLWSVSIGINDPNSAIAPAAAFIEFLPVEAGSDFTRCVTLDKVEVGKTYELIITNLSGFYRYRMSDAVQVTGFFYKTPKVQFMYRVNRTINLAEEKTTEKALQVTVENVAKELGFTLADFCVYPDTDVTPNKYVFLIEPHREVPRIDSETLKECVFKYLCEANPVYYDCYADKWLDKPEAFFLQPETSLLYRDMMVYRGASLNQLKPVRIIMNERQKKFFFGLRY